MDVGTPAPNDRRKKLLELIEKNPALAVQLKQNPALIQELMGGQNFLEKLFTRGQDPALEAINAMPISPAQQLAFDTSQRANSLSRIDLDKNAIADASVNMPAGSKINNGRIELTPEQKEELDAMRSKIMGIDSSIDRSATKANAAQNAASAEHLREIVAEKKSEKEANLEADQLIAQLGLDPTKGLYRYASPFAEGVEANKKLTPQQLQTLQRSSKYKEIIEREQEDYWKSKQLEENNKLRTERDTDRDNLREDNAVQRRMDYIYMQTGRQVSADAVRAALKDPRVLEPYKSMKQTDVPPDQIHLWDLAQADKAVFSKRINTEVKAADAALRNDPIYKRVFTPPRGVSIKEEDILNLNARAAEIYSMVDGSIPAPKWELRKKIIGSNKPIRLISNHPVLNQTYSDVSDTADSEAEALKPKGLFKSDEALNQAASMAKEKNATDAQILAGLRTRFPQASPEQLTATLQDIKQRIQ